MNDPLLSVLMHDIGESKHHQNQFTNTNPYIRPEADENSWHGIRFLGAGSFGCAGLWVHVDEANNITDVSKKSSDN